MKTLRETEVKAVFSNIEEILPVNGDYALVDSNMQVKSMCIYTVKNGKLYDDISFDIDPKEYSNDDISELKEYSEGLQFAMLAKQYNFSYPD